VPEAIDFERHPAGAPDPLPRGRHKLPLETVRANQRERLLRAMLESVGERGYEATTVPEVIAQARVSRNAFYELFTDKVDCFLVLCEELADQLLEETFRAVDVTDWRVAVRDGTRRYLAWWQARPLFARSYLLELPTAGTRALSHRNRQYDRFAERFALVAELARRQEPDLAPLRPHATLFLVTAITELVGSQLAARSADELTSLEDEIVWLIERLLAEGGR
jgi:AcrR family transcriptional regulator